MKSLSDKIGTFNPSAYRFAQLDEGTKPWSVKLYPINMSPEVEDDPYDIALFESNEEAAAFYETVEASWSVS